MTEKPKWIFKIGEDLARWIASNSITKLTHHWKFTGEDTSVNWIEMHNDKNETRKMPPVMQFGEVSFNPDHRTLIQLRNDVEKQVREIIEWERKHKNKIEEFNKLKNELGL